jgi:hypothetical protein
MYSVGLINEYMLIEMHGIPNVKIICADVLLQSTEFNWEECEATILLDLMHSHTLITS